MPLLRALFLFLAAWSGAQAGTLLPELDSPQCRAFPDAPPPPGDDVPYGQGLLWELSKGQEVHHLFGTIHVGDADIKQLPEPVQQALNDAELLVVEATMDAGQMARISSRMFHLVPPDGGLRAQLDAVLFSRMVEILARYQMNEQMSNSLKPWAAYLTMSYPLSEDPVILDLHLIHQARARGMAVVGLEEPVEQLAYFEAMPAREQLQILIDTVCHYTSLEQDFTVMKEMYLERRLGDLHALVMHDAELSGDAMYQRLLAALVTGRNHSMHETLRATLGQQRAFIAIGAMHLPGAEGVLSLLAQDGYRITSLY